MKLTEFASFSLGYNQYFGDLLTVDRDLKTQTPQKTFQPIFQCKQLKLDHELYSALILLFENIWKGERP